MAGRGWRRRGWCARGRGWPGRTGSRGSCPAVMSGWAVSTVAPWARWDGGGVEQLDVSRRRSRRAGVTRPPWAMLRTVRAPSGWRWSTCQASPFLTQSRPPASRQAAVVVAGDDPVAAPGEVAVVQRAPSGSTWPAATRSARAGRTAAVTSALASGGHQGDLPGEHVGLPAVVGGLGHGLAGAAADPAVVGVPVDRRRVAGAELQGGGGLGGVAEPVQRGQLRGARLRRRSGAARRRTRRRAAAGHRRAAGRSRPGRRRWQ